MNPRTMYPRLILVAVIGLVYANTFMNSFHFDDVTSILEKPWVRGIEKISLLFNKQALFQRPLVLLSFNINYIISEFEVASYHLFNVQFSKGFDIGHADHTDLIDLFKDWDQRRVRLRRSSKFDFVERALVATTAHAKQRDDDKADQKLCPKLKWNL